MKKITKIFLILLCVVVIFVCILSCFSNKAIKLNVVHSKKEQLETNNKGLEQTKLRVLVIEMDPTLKTQNNKRCSEYKPYGDYAGNTELISEEVLEDLNYSSHGYVNTELVGDKFKEIFKNDDKISIVNNKIRLNEFPTYTKEIELKNGKKSYSLDEETWIEIMQHGNGEGTSEHPTENEEGYQTWHKYRNQITTDENCRFDYNYLVKRLKLSEYRDNFDWVLFASIEPSKCFESCMVGKTAYWINGATYKNECKNFPIIWANITRRDTILHSIGHMSENIMSYVFNGTYSQAPKIKITNQEDYDKLNLWQKFVLSNVNLTQESVHNYIGVGNVHYAPNSIKDYEYNNYNYEYSNWKDWRYNYPNLKGKWELINSNVWTSGTKEDPKPSGNQSPDRLKQRWWFKCMPHTEGRNEDGYYNNWWKYITTMDYVEKITPIADRLELTLGENNEKLSYKCIYQSKKEETISSNEDIKIKDTDILELSSNGKLVGKKCGETTVQIYIDGKSISVPITIKEKLKIEFVDYREINENEKKYIENISPSTVLEEFKAKINTNGDKQILKDDSIIKDSKTKISTGMKVKISLNNQIAEYKIAVKGDTNGDGECDLKDLLQVNKHRLNKIQLKDEFLRAGDINNDNGVDIRDLLQMNKFRLGKLST